jgi:hypothetical protein
MDRISGKTEYFLPALSAIGHIQETDPVCSRKQQIPATEDRFAGDPYLSRSHFDKEYKPGQVSGKDESEPSSFSSMKILWHVRH